jgi:hypothetical protein
VSAILYTLLCGALYYLGYWAEATTFFHSRLTPGSFWDRLFSCPACSGFWYGLLVGAIGALLKTPFLGMRPEIWIQRCLSVPAVALCSLIWTPIMAAVQFRAFDVVSEMKARTETSEAPNVVTKVEITS